jgi:hypothetical protein
MYVHVQLANKMGLKKSYTAGSKSGDNLGEVLFSNGITDRCLTPRRIGRLTVGRNVTLTLTLTLMA